MWYGGALFCQANKCGELTATVRARAVAATEQRGAVALLRVRRVPGAVQLRHLDVRVPVAAGAHQPPRPHSLPPPRPPNDFQGTPPFTLSDTPLTLGRRRRGPGAQEKNR